VALLGLQRSVAETATRRLAGGLAEADGVHLLQRQLESKQLDTAQAHAGGAIRGNRDLVLMHIPFNFGHTIESVAMFGRPHEGYKGRDAAWDYIEDLGVGSVDRRASWEEVHALMREKGEVWGHLNPDLQENNGVTGCPMYYTPQKYWPRELAERYFGNKTIFGMLRDPYERLVSIFRGNVPEYGGSHPGLISKCDVNEAVKRMMREYIYFNKTYANGCTLVPQAEYFEGPYGIQLPVDNRQFPSSMSHEFVRHGYPDFQIKTEEVIHVELCPDVWAADLDNEARSLVKQVYKRDFELLCRHFGYCDDEESTCIWQVPRMCPKYILKQGYKGRPMALQPKPHWYKFWAR